MLDLTFIGPGRVGLALGYALWQADGLSSLAYMGRRAEPPAHPLFMQGSATYEFGLVRPAAGTDAVLLTVPDDVLPELAAALAALGPAPGPGCAALHCSGALSADVLGPLHRCGYSVGSLHPLQAVAEPLSGSERLRGVSFAVSGEPGAVGVGRRIVSLLEGRLLEVPVSQRATYHAAAAVASNGLAAVLAAAGRMLASAGVPPEETLPALLPLVRGTLANIDELGLLSALTGPVVRGDQETVRLHLRALHARDADLYRALSRELARLAAERSGDAAPDEQLWTLLEDEG